MVCGAVHRYTAHQPITEMLIYTCRYLKVHKLENFLGTDIEICTFS
jgi:hypothetical protein